MYMQEDTKPASSWRSLFKRGSQASFSEIAPSEPTVNSSTDLIHSR